MMKHKSKVKREREHDVDNLEADKENRHVMGDDMALGDLHKQSLNSASGDYVIGGTDIRVLDMCQRQIPHDARNSFASQFSPNNCRIVITDTVTEPSLATFLHIMQNNSRGLFVLFPNNGTM